MPFLSRTVNRPPVATAAALSAVDISEYNSHVTCVVVEFNTLYEYNKASTAPAEGERIILPDVGPGAWFRIASEDIGNVVASLTSSSNSRALAASQGKDLNEKKTSRLDTPWKDKVEVATTGNITLSGEQTIDGVLTSDSRVLVRAQTDATENGMYRSASSTWGRTADGDDGLGLVNSTVPVVEGTTFQGTIFKNTNTDIIIGVTSITYAIFDVSPLDEVLITGNSTGANDIIVDNGQAIQTATLAGDTFELKAFDVNGVSYTTFITFTANNMPTCDLTTAVTRAGNTILDDTSTVSALTTVGIISSGQWLATDIAIFAGGTGASSANGARTNLGLEIGADVQAFDTDLLQIAGLATSDSNFIVGDGTKWISETGNAARTSLGLGTGDSPTFTALTTTGPLTSGTILVGGTQSLDDSGTPYNGLDVSGATSVLVDVSGGPITINDFSGGILGQIVLVVKIGASTNTLTVMNSSGANQQIRFQGTADYAPPGKNGGFAVVFDGTDWLASGSNT